MSAPDFDRLTHAGYGKPLLWWHYTDTFAVAAFRDRKGRRLALPAVRNGANCYWHEPPQPLPLYRAAALKVQPEAPVLLLESESAADGACALFPDHVCIAWPGGCNAVNKADIRPLWGRDVILWHGGIAPVSTAMARLQVRLRGMARSIVMLDAPRMWPVAWEFAEAPPADTVVAELRRVLRKAGADHIRPAPASTPLPAVPAPRVVPSPSHRERPRIDTPVVLSDPSAPLGAGAKDPAVDGSRNGGADDPPPASSLRQAPQGPPPRAEPRRRAGRQKLPRAPSARARPPHPAPAAKARTSPAADEAWPEPDLSLLDDCRADVPAFPLGVLPRFWSDWCRRAARAAEAPVDYVAPALLTAGAGLIGGARWVSAVPSWSEPCALWTALVGAPASGRTRGMDAALDLVRQLQGNPPATSDVSDRRMPGDDDWVLILERIAQEQAREKAAASGSPLPELPKAVLKPPPRPVIIDELHMQAVAGAMRSNPRGILLAPDSLCGWLGSVQHSARPSAERRARLRSWSGRPWTLDGSGWIAAQAPYAAVSILGTMDADNLSATLADDAEMGARLLFTWPGRVAQPLAEAVDADDAWCPVAQAALARLRDMPDRLRIVALSSDAREAFRHFHRAHGIDADKLDGAAGAWWGKGARTVLRLAGVLTFLEWAAMPDGTEEPAEVAAGAVRAAIGLWRDYWWPHAQAVFRGNVSSGDERWRHAHKVLRWLATHRLDEVLRVQIRVEALSRRVDAEGAERVAALLVDRGWLREVEHEPDGPGRPPRCWAVNPILLQDRLIHTLAIGARGLYPTPAVTIESCANRPGNAPELEWPPKVRQE